MSRLSDAEALSAAFIAEALAPRVSPATDELRLQLAKANTAADAAIVAYKAQTARLQAVHANSPSGYQIAKRDDPVVDELARRVVFHTSQATRLAATLTAELLAELVERNHG